MKEIVLLVCEECKRRNYSTERDKKKMTTKLMLKKFCPFCRKHIVHKEKKA